MAEIDSEVPNRREVDRVQRPNFDWKQCRRGREDSIVDPDQIDSLEYCTTPGESLLSLKQQCSQHLGSRDRARNKRSASSQESTKRSGLGFSDGEFHQG